MHTHDDRPLPARDAIGGSLLLATAALAIFFMMHHPHGGHGGGAVDGLRAAAAGAGLVRGVHGALIAVMFLYAYAHTALARALGLERPLALAGLVAYLGGASALGLAGVLNGFVHPALAEHYADAGPSLAEMVQVAVRAQWELNQALAAVGALAISAALLAWSLLLLGLRGAWRWIGALGLAVGAGAGLGLLGGWIELDVHGFGRVVFAQAAWAAAAGWALRRPERDA